MSWEDDLINPCRLRGPAHTKPGKHQANACTTGRQVVFKFFSERGTTLSMDSASCCCDRPEQGTVVCREKIGTLCYADAYRNLSCSELYDRSCP